MPIEIQEVEVLPPPAAAPAMTPSPNPPTPQPAERGEQLRTWQRELAERADRLRAD
jgi:hypothetical protein